MDNAEKKIDAIYNRICEYMQNHNGEKPEEIVITQKDFDEMAYSKNTYMVFDKNEITHIYGVKIKIEK